MYDGTQHEYAYIDGLKCALKELKRIEKAQDKEDQENSGRHVAAMRRAEAAIPKEARS